MQYSLNSLDQKYAKSVLLKLYEEGSCLKTNLQSIVKNLYSLDRLLDSLKDDGLINVEKKPFGKNIQEISLTEKGKRVARQLKNVEEPQKEVIPYSLSFEIIKFLAKNGPSTVGEIITAYANSSEILETLKKEGLILSEINKSVYPPVNIISLTEKGKQVVRNLMRIDRYLVDIPEGLLRDIEEIIEKDKSYSSIEEFINSAVRNAIERWRRNHAVG